MIRFFIGRYLEQPLLPGRGAGGAGAGAARSRSSNPRKAMPTGRTSRHDPALSQLARSIWGTAPAMGMADFLVAESNQAAVTWLDRWPGWPGSALGDPWARADVASRTLTRVWAARSGRRCCWMPDALVRDRPRRCLPADPTRGRCLTMPTGSPARSAEETLLHLYNLVAERDGYLLLTGATAPARWPLSLPDLTSRLKAMPAVAVGDPDDPLLAAVLVKLFADRQLAVGGGGDRLPAAAHGAQLRRRPQTGRGDRRGQPVARRRPVTVPLARTVLEELGFGRVVARRPVRPASSATRSRSACRRPSRPRASGRWGIPGRPALWWGTLSAADWSQSSEPVLASWTPPARAGPGL